MNFLVDAQLPPALARWISSHGHRATHVFDIGLHEADDPVIWEHARKENAVIILRLAGQPSAPKFRHDQGTKVGRARHPPSLA